MSKLPNPIPLDAKKIAFKYGLHKGVYHVWRRGNKWFWSAMGSNGEEDTIELACEMARQWIISDRIKINEQ